MPRLRQVPRSEISEIMKPLFERFFGDRDPVEEPGTSTGTPGNWWTVLALAPHVYQQFSSLAPMVHPTGKPPGSLDPKVRQLCAVRAAFNSRSVFIYSQQCKASRVVGVEEQELKAIPGWEVSDCFSARERAALAWADALVLQRGDVPDAIFNSLHEHFDDAEILELSWVTLCYDMYSVVSVALRLEYDDIEQRIREIPVPEEGGVADWR